MSERPEYEERATVRGYGLHICQRDGDWTVWLNTEVADFDGLVLGVGATRDLAVSNAVASVEAIERVLQLSSPIVSAEAPRG